LTERNQNDWQLWSTGKGVYENGKSPRERRKVIEFLEEDCTKELVELFCMDFSTLFWL
jgi:hypothetical protein